MTAPGRVQVSAESLALAALAHELKGPLQTMGNLLYLIGNDASSASSRRQQWVDQACEELERIKQITASLLEASRERSSESDIELSTILEHSIDSFAEKIAFKRITVDKRIECRGIIRSAPVEIRHVFDNVIANALEAVPPGGKITAHLKESRDWRDSAGRGCRLLVCDNGPGIQPEDRDKIFEPFFTTKIEKGTGIGLWAVQRLLRKHGGSIRFRSSVRAENHGTAFSVFLPTEATTSAIDG